MAPSPGLILDNVEGSLINELRDIATVVERLPVVTASPDPDDNDLPAIAEAGKADFPVTGDKRDLLALRLHEGPGIMTVRDFLVLHRRLP
jgi:hypothetical protein